MDYAICYQLPNGHWYTKNCEDGGSYIRELLKRGINEFSVQVWSNARTIDMYRADIDGNLALVVSKTYAHYHTQKGIVYDYRINGCRMLSVGKHHLIMSC